MATFVTTYQRNAIVNWLYRGGSAPYNGTVYLALFTVAPTIGGGGTEVSGGSYTRQSITNASGNWVAPDANSMIVTVNDVTFTTATGSWGTIVGLGLFDASSGGNLLYYADLSASKTVGIGDQFKIVAPNLSFKLN